MLTDEVTLAEENRRLRIALDAAELGTWQHDFTTGRVVLDARACAQYGLDRREVLFRDVTDKVHPDDRERLATERAAVLGRDGLEVFRTEYRVLDPDGQSRRLQVQVRVEFAGTGADRRAVFGYGTARDVTALRAADALILEQQILLREVGEIARVGGWDFDPITGEGAWTEETFRIHGLSGPPDKASSGLDRFDGDARAVIEAALAAAIDHGTPYDLELPFTALDGEAKWVRAVCRPVVADGRVVRLRGTLQDITVQKRSQVALDRFIQASPVVVYALAVEEPGLRLIWTGGDVERLTGWPADDVRTVEWWQARVHPEDWPRVAKSTPAPYDLDHATIEFRLRKRDGTYMWVRDERRLLRDAAGRPSEVVGSWSDATERVGLESQLRQAQKLEAIGQLAGGVAHDFNNLLTVIMGNAELLAPALAADDDRRMLDEIGHASERAALLTRQLLAFSRKQLLQPAVVSMNDEMTRIDGMLHRLLGENIEIQLALGADAGHILVDPGQFGQIVLNLAVNARDAMPRGGTLRLTTDAVDRVAQRGVLQAVPSAHGFARLTIADTGSGMTPDVQAHIFEPFFTTKPPGQGTGLGLATVFGIMQQSGGAIDVHSEPNGGATFALYFPRTVAAGSGGRELALEHGGHETVLLVEDDDAVRDIAVRALTRKGYRVITMCSPAEVLAANIALASIDLLLTDVVMPGMSGRELAQVLRDVRPDLKVLFMSGYVQDRLERQGLTGAGDAFLHKPFSAAEIARHVRLVLDRPVG